MAEATVIAIVGAPRTGKTTLAAALARRLAEETGLRCTWVPQRLPPDADAAAHDVVVCDGPAAASPVALTLLTALDLPGVADGAEAADAALRQQLQAARRPWLLISGRGEARLEAALDAVATLLRTRRTPRSGLLTRLAQREAAAPQWQWVCEKCDVPECEHAQLLSSTHPRRAAGPPAE